MRIWKSQHSHSLNTKYWSLNKLLNIRAVTRCNFPMNVPATMNDCTVYHRNAQTWPKLKLLRNKFLSSCDLSCSSVSLNGYLLAISNKLAWFISHLILTMKIANCTNYITPPKISCNAMQCRNRYSCHCKTSCTKICNGVTTSVVLDKISIDKYDVI